MINVRTTPSEPSTRLVPDSASCFLAVILLNVLSFFSPIKDLIQNGVREGFIQPSNASLITFVDGPEDTSQHETFDWGEAALKALDTWNGSDSVVYPYDWTKKIGETGEVKRDRLEFS